jgi:hypothetical protein
MSAVAKLRKRKIAAEIRDIALDMIRNRTANLMCLHFYKKACAPRVDEKE